MLGALLAWPALLPEAAKLLEPHMFWDAGHRVVYAVLRDLGDAPGTPWAAGDHVLSRELVEAALRDRGLAVPAVLWQHLEDATLGAATHGGHLRWFAERVLDAWKRREAMQRLSQAVQQAHGDSAEAAVLTAEQLCADLEVLERRLHGGRVEAWLDVMAAQREAQAAQREAQADAPLGVPTGIAWLDERTDGFVPGRVWVLGGYTGVGKSWFAAWTKVRLLEAGLRLLDLSLEMGPTDTLYKLLACKAGVPAPKAMAGTLRPDERARWEQAEAWLRELDESGTYRLYTDQYRLQGIVRLVRAERPEALVLDYVQNLTRAAGEREYDVLTAAMQAVRALATTGGRELFALVVSQLSNDGYRYGRDQDRQFLSFKGSGQLGQDASVALELERDKSQEAPRRDQRNWLWVPLTLRLKKNRWGAEGEQAVRFAPAVGHFQEGQG